MQPESLHEWMWPHYRACIAPRYVALDSTRSRDLQRWLRALPPTKCRSLWPYPLGAALADYSPYVVALSDTDGFWDTWFSQGIDQHWGIIIEADASLEQLSRHLQSFTHVRCAGKTLLNRFYDPRVFPAWLSVLDSTQQRGFAISSLRRIWWTEAPRESTSRLRCLTNTRGRLNLFTAPFTLDDFHDPATHVEPQAATETAGDR